MVTLKEMLNCQEKKIRLYGTNGKILEDYCHALYWERDEEDEEPELEVGEHWLIPQSQIERIEILD